MSMSGEERPAGLACSDQKMAANDLAIKAQELAWPIGLQILVRRECRSPTIPGPVLGGRHYWMGKDGALEFVDNATKRSGTRDSWNGWREFTPNRVPHH